MTDVHKDIILNIFKPRPGQTQWWMGDGNQFPRLEPGGASIDYVHSVTKVTKGVRYTCASWFTQQKKMEDRDATTVFEAQNFAALRCGRSRASKGD